MIVCADDFGISASVSEDILALIEMRRLSATSCMVTGCDSSLAAFSKLKDFRDQVDIGLHLVLSCDRPVSLVEEASGLVDSSGRFFNFGEFARRCYLRQVSARAMRVEIEAQLLRFREIMDFWPHYVDGHQHVQQLPVVRDVLVDLLGSLLSKPFYVRHGHAPMGSLLGSSLSAGAKAGALMISLPSGALRRRLAERSIAFNTGLWGYYRVGQDSVGEAFAEYFRLSKSRNDILFCHPGRVDDELRSKDSLTSPREEVSRYLRSSEYLELSGGRLNRFLYS